ncbi:MAG TPA: PLP-dependent aminotransferase family protein [Acidimicrobiales bacterium]|nr:PLP-dependent aminotransferase family protein [Acidimicrobiales bacterium]
MRDLRSHLARNSGSSRIRELLHLTERPDMLSLAGGLPATEALPVARIRSALANTLDARALQYGPSEGVRDLREFVAHRCGARLVEVLITSGAQQALDLLAHAVIDDGDTAVVESPSYLGATQVLQNAGASITAVASDGDGLDTRTLNDMVARGLRPKLIYVVSNFHNPTGVTLSEARRRELAEIATRVGALLVDDDPYGELRFAGQAVPPIAAPSLVRVGTVSKVLAPGLRVGWMVGPTWLIDACVRLKQATDLHTSTLSQCVALDLLRDRAWFAEHLSFIRALYRERAQTLVDTLTDRLGDRITIAPVHGGLFAWVRFVDGTDADDLFARSVGHGVAFVPGSSFGVDPAHRAAARLCFASLPPARLVDAVDRLTAAATASSVGVLRVSTPVKRQQNGQSKGVERGQAKAR